MGRPPRAVNDDLTLEVGIDELEIVGYEAGQYVAINSDHEVPVCPKCKSKCINHKIRKRIFTDVIHDETGKAKMIYLRYDQYMYRCQNKKCRHLFAKEISFARKNAKVTKRFEKQIARMALSKTYGEIKSKFGENLARSTIKDVLDRWGELQNRRQKFIFTPRVLCVFPFKANSLEYVVFADGTDEKKLVIDVIANYTSAKVIEALNRLDMNVVEEIIIDTTPELVSLIQDYFAGIELQIHPRSLLQSARIDFKSIIHEDGLYIRNDVKKSMLKAPDEFKLMEGDGQFEKDYNARINEELGFIRAATETRPRINSAYTLFLELHKALLPEMDYDVLNSWKESIQLAATVFSEAERTLGYLHEDDFGLTLGYIETYMQELMTFYLRRTNVTQEIYDQLYELNEILNNFHTYSDESLRCKILYLADAVTEEINGKKYWHGVPIEDIIEKIEKLK